MVASLQTFLAGHTRVKSRKSVRIHPDPLALIPTSSMNDAATTRSFPDFRQLARFAGHSGCVRGELFARSGFGAESPQLLSSRMLIKPGHLGSASLPHFSSSPLVGAVTRWWLPSAPSQSWPRARPEPTTPAKCTRGD
jgi:hypothetical protein